MISFLKYEGPNFTKILCSIKAIGVQQNVPISELQPHRGQKQKQDELGQDGPDPLRAKPRKGVICLPGSSILKENMLEYSFFSITQIFLEHITLTCFIQKMGKRRCQRDVEQLQFPFAQKKKKKKSKP